MISPVTFRVECDQIEVTSMHRPAVGWKHVDAAGHPHQWHVTGSTEPASSYSPSQSYDVPTLIWVKDGEEWYEDDDEPHDVGHLECRQCGEHVTPAYTADAFRQYVPGLRRLYINDEPVTEAEFAAARALTQKE